MTFREAFRHYRLAAKYTQRKVSTELDVSVTAVSMWETGNSISTIKHLVQLETMFGCQLGDLIIPAAYRNTQPTLAPMDKTPDFKEVSA